MIDKILATQQDVYVIDRNDYSRYVKLDLSENNKELTAERTADSKNLGQYIDQLIANDNGSIGFGGYNEVRNLYRRSTIFNDVQTDERNIHIGIDLWVPAGTPVLAALDGTVHSFQYNSGLGNYGPTIILKHTIDNQTFYTLYGHLSSESIVGIAVGDPFEKAQKIGELGNESVNGDYPPHLHFQIIIDIGQYVGDYPGVCSRSELDYYLNNCPNPNLLLKIN